MHKGNVKSGWWWAADALFSASTFLIISILLVNRYYRYFTVALGWPQCQCVWWKPVCVLIWKQSSDNMRLCGGHKKIRGRQSNSIKRWGQLQSGKKMSLSVLTEWWRHVTLHCSPNHHIQMAAGPVNAALLTCGSHSTLWSSHTP